MSSAINILNNRVLSFHWSQQSWFTFKCKSDTKPNMIGLRFSAFYCNVNDTDSIVVYL